MLTILRALAVAFIALSATGASAAPLSPNSATIDRVAPSVLLQPVACRREPVWGFRISAFCKPTGICPDRVIKSYRTVCS
jgi:hypothetical protein